MQDGMVSISLTRHTGFSECDQMHVVPIATACCVSGVTYQDADSQKGVHLHTCAVYNYFTRMLLVIF